MTLTPLHSKCVYVECPPSYQSKSFLTQYRDCLQPLNGGDSRGPLPHIEFSYIRQLQQDLWLGWAYVSSALMLDRKIQIIKFKLGHWWSYCRTQQALQSMKRNHFSQVQTHALLSSKSPAITTVYNLSWVEFTTTNTQIVLTTESCKPEGQYSTCAKHRSLTLFTQVLGASLTSSTTLNQPCHPNLICLK